MSAALLRRCAPHVLHPTTSAAAVLAVCGVGERRSRLLPPHRPRRQYGAYPSERALFSVRLKIQSEADADELLKMMKGYEKRYLQRALAKQLKASGVVDSAIAGVDAVEEQQQRAADADQLQAGPVTSAQFRALFLYNAIPFVGFGFLDNMVMIMAGGYIDLTIGVTLGLSTLAAAGLGNLISDVAGVGLAHYVESVVAKFFGIAPPALTPAQAVSGRARAASNGGKIIGLSVGCILGLFPLLIFDFEDNSGAANKVTESDEGGSAK